MHGGTGPDVRLRPIATLHALTVANDEAIPHMISLIFVAAYEGGEVRPGDGMLGSSYQWADIADILAGQVNVIVPVANFGCSPGLWMSTIYGGPTTWNCKSSLKRAKSGPRHSTTSLCAGPRRRTASVR